MSTGMTEHEAKREMAWKRIASHGRLIHELAAGHSWDKDAVWLTIARMNEVKEIAEEIGVEIRVLERIE